MLSLLSHHLPLPLKSALSVPLLLLIISGLLVIFVSLTASRLPGREFGNICWDESVTQLNGFFSKFCSLWPHWSMTLILTWPRNSLSHHIPWLLILLLTSPSPTLGCSFMDIFPTPLIPPAPYMWLRPAGLRPSLSPHSILQESQEMMTMMICTVIMIIMASCVLETWLVPLFNPTTRYDVGIITLQYGWESGGSEMKRPMTSERQNRDWSPGLTVLKVKTNTQRRIESEN